MLTSTGLEKAINNSFYFKQIEMIPGKNTMVSSNESDLERYYKCPPYFLIAFESQLKLSSTLKIIKGLMKSRELNVNEINKVLDAIFVMDRGWIIHFGDGKGSFKFKSSEGVSSEGWVWQNSETVLFDFLGWLLAVMPRMVRFEPIFSQYFRYTR